MSEGLVERLKEAADNLFSNLNWTDTEALIGEASARILALEKEVAAAYSRGREAAAKVVDQFAGQCCNQDDGKMTACCALTIAAAIRSLPDEAAPTDSRTYPAGTNWRDG